MSAVEVEVYPGEVAVNSVAVMLEREDFLVLSVDLHTKYAEVMTVSHDSENAYIYLHASENSLHVDEPRRGSPTTVTIKGFGMDKGWVWPITSVGRYTLEAVLYRRPTSKALGDYAVIWDGEQQGARRV